MAWKEIYRTHNTIVPPFELVDSKARFPCSKSFFFMVSTTEFASNYLLAYIHSHICCYIVLVNVKAHLTNQSGNTADVTALMSNFPTLIIFKVSQGHAGVAVLPEAKFEIQFLICHNLHHPDILSKNLMLLSWNILAHIL